MPTNGLVRSKSNHGFTLMESLIALIVTSMLTIGVARMMDMQRAVSSDAQVHSEIDKSLMILSKNLTKFFKIRAQSGAYTNYSGDLSAQGSQLGFKHYTKINQAVSAAPTATALFAAQCVPAPARATLLNPTDRTKLAGLATFKCPTGGCPSCLTCSAGMMPIVRLTDPDSGTTVTFPAGGGRSASLQPFSAGICVQRDTLGSTNSNLLVNISMAAMTGTNMLVVVTKVMHLTGASQASGVEMLR